MLFSQEQFCIPTSNAEKVCIEPPYHLSANILFDIANITAVILRKSYNMFYATVMQRKGSSHISIVSVVRKNCSIVGNMCFE